MGKFKEIITDEPLIKAVESDLSETDLLTLQLREARPLGEGIEDDLYHVTYRMKYYHETPSYEDLADLLRRIEKLNRILA